MSKVKSGMEAVIAKSQKRAPLFKRKLADKLASESSTKSAPKGEYGKKQADKPAESMAETDPKSLSAKMDACMARLDALEAKFADKSDDETEDDD
jgi:hypothetical protein